MSSPYAARCSHCGAGVIEALYGDPSVPIYACGSFGNARPACIPAPADDGPNVVALTASDVVALGELVMDVHVTRIAERSRVPVVGLCARMDCDSVGIDGRCLKH